MKYIKNLNDLKSHGSMKLDPIFEMARINDPKEFPFDVFVYGGDSYGHGRNEHGEPHFHFADKIKGGKWQFSVFIPTVDQWKQQKELYIYESSDENFYWTGLRKEKRSLIEWLDKPSKMMGGVLTNLEVIRGQWNILNTDNKNVSQITRIK